MKKQILVVMMLMCVITASAQDEKKKILDVNADFMSRFIWRGMNVSHVPNIQPNICYNSSFGLKVGAWASASVTGDYAEVDLYGAYSLKGFSLTVTDYFIADETKEFNKYFNCKNESTGHMVEAALAYDGPEKFPIHLLAGTFVYGADKTADVIVIDTITSDTTTTFKNQYSTYFELGYTIRNVNIFVGITPQDGMYGNTFGVVNAGITAKRDIRITDKFTLPVQASLITNPQKGNIYLVFGFSL
jgi:hypothetical protein